ncbi:hypothetical protein ACN47E_003171 [Coniothyrium glycines]
MTRVVRKVRVSRSDRQRLDRINTGGSLDDTLVVYNTERFWLEYTRRPATQRTQSAPGVSSSSTLASNQLSLTVSTRPKSEHCLVNATVRLRPTRTTSPASKRGLPHVRHRYCHFHDRIASFTKARWGSLKSLVTALATRIENFAQKLYLAVDDALDQHGEAIEGGVAALYRCRKYVAKLLYGGVCIACTLYLCNKYTTSVVEIDSECSMLVAKYRHFPSWMHTDPLQVLGLPAAVAPGFMSHQDVVDAALKTSRMKWHPDKWRQNGFSSADEAQTASMRIVEAYHSIEDFLFNPYCEEDTAALHRGQNGSMSYNDGLPSFSNPCRCTRPTYYDQKLRKTIASFLPWAVFQQQETSIESACCPCNRAIAQASWNTFTAENQPPFIRRIYNSLPWLTRDWRVFKYKLFWHLHGVDPTSKHRGRVGPWGDAHVAICLHGKLRGCEAMPGWAVDYDFDSYRWHCEEWTVKQRLKERRASEAEKLYEESLRAEKGTREAEGTSLSEHVDDYGEEIEWTDDDEVIDE